MASLLSTVEIYDSYNDEFADNIVFVSIQLL